MLTFALGVVTITMPHKRKNRSSTKSSADMDYASAPTLKEYIWKELTTIIQRHSTEPLHDKDLSGPAMKRFK
jgi:hypothetical protein